MFQMYMQTSFGSRNILEFDYLPMKRLYVATNQLHEVIIVVGTDIGILALSGVSKQILVFLE
jgi:hypothetical protein